MVSLIAHEAESWHKHHADSQVVVQKRATDRAQNNSAREGEEQQEGGGGRGKGREADGKRPSSFALFHTRAA